MNARADVVYIAREDIPNTQALAQRTNLALRDRELVREALQQNLVDIGAGHVIATYQAGKRSLFAVDAETTTLSLTHADAEGAARMRCVLTIVGRAYPMRIVHPSASSRDYAIKIANNRIEFDTIVCAAMHEPRVLAYLSRAMETIKPAETVT